MSLALAFGIVTIACWAILAIVVSRFRPPRPLWARRLLAQSLRVSVVGWRAGHFLSRADRRGTLDLADRALHGRSRQRPALVVVVPSSRPYSPLEPPLGDAGGRARTWRRWTVCWLGLLTNPWLVWFIEPRWEGRNEYRVLWYVQAVSSYLVLAAALALFRWVRRQKEPSSRARVQLDTLSIAAAIPFLFNALYVSRVVSPGFDPLFSLSVSL